MTNHRPYNDEDLRTEAGHALSALAHPPTAEEITTSLRHSYIPHLHADGNLATWGDLLDETELNQAARQIHERMILAAPVGPWAVNLGADGLEPTAHVINLDSPDGPFVRLHLAIHPDMPEADRLRLHAGLKRVITDAIGQLAPVEDTLPAWLAQRFDPRGPEWDALADDDRTYWEHHAAAVRRAVARGGFKTAEGAQR